MDNSQPRQRRRPAEQRRPDEQQSEQPQTQGQPVGRPPQQHGQQHGQQQGSRNSFTWGVVGFWIVTIIIFGGLSLYRLTPSNAAEPTVRTAQGKIVGKVLSNDDLPVPIEAWLGVPYAKPPTGQLRFARPKRLDPRRQNLEAKEYGHRCPGKQLLKAAAGIPEENEDCLTVNVFKQQGSPKKQPVMVYVHGGAFNRGYSSMHDTASMVSWSPEPFIGVSFNYRLGALGFLPSGVAAREGILNLGLRDQVLLLEWVQKNVEAFGGDPRSVTVVGLSAGAHSVGHHIMNINDRRELFHRAVIESGGATSRAIHRPDAALHEDQFRQLLEKTGCQDEAVDRQIKCLRKVSSAEIIDAQAEVFDRYRRSLRWAWQPCIDDDLISRHPVDAWKSGDWNNVPILTGFQHNEGPMYVPKDLSSDREFIDFFRTLLPQLTDSDLKRLSELYSDPDTDPSSPYLDTRDLDKLGIGSQFKRLEAAYGHYAYVCAVRQTAHLGAAAQSEPIYLYHWALNRTVIGGANHADQMRYETMSSSVRGLFDVHDRIAEDFHAYVTSFVLTGDPNKVPGLAPGRPRWGPFRTDTSEGDTMLFGMGNDEAAGGENEGSAADFVSDAWAKGECDFWWEMSEKREA